MGSTDFRLGETGNMWSYAGWSVKTIYTSPGTLAHQMYLFDTFRYWDEHQDESFTVDGFLAPAGIGDEDEAVKITCFVGEGDSIYTGDNIYLNGHPLNTGGTASPADNVWNSQSTGSTADGVDLDTFIIDGSEDVIDPRADSATVRLQTGVDSWNLVYIMLSFRSDIVGSGLLSYIVK